MTERDSNQTIEQADHTGLQAIGELAGHGRVRVTELTLGIENAMNVQMTDQQGVDMGVMPGVSTPAEEADFKVQYHQELERVHEINQQEERRSAHATRVKADRAIALKNRKGRRGW